MELELSIAKITRTLQLAMNTSELRVRTKYLIADSIIELMLFLAMELLRNGISLGERLSMDLVNSFSAVLALLNTVHFPFLFFLNIIIFKYCAVQNTLIFCTYINGIINI